MRTPERRCCTVCPRRPVLTHHRPALTHHRLCSPLPRPHPQFIDGFKGLVVPSHLRPPAQAINWIPLTGDPEVDAAMQVGGRVGGKQN